MHFVLSLLLLFAADDESAAEGRRLPFFGASSSSKPSGNNKHNAFVGDGRTRDRLTTPPSLVLEYGIFRGRSSLRDLSPEDTRLFDDRDYYPELASSKSLLAIALLLRGRGDAAHETVLGVDASNLGEAEYAATHPGKNHWSERHPLSDVDDMVHSIVHRLEGDAWGEGNQTGWENAKYWVSGGPKRHEEVPPASVRNRSAQQRRRHPVPVQLARYARSFAPHAVAAGVVVDGGAEDDDGAMTSDNRRRCHAVIAGGGEQRTVAVAPGCWDPIRFIDLLSEQKPKSSETDRCNDGDGDGDNTSLARELELLRAEELRLLIRYEQLRLEGYSDDDIREKFREEAAGADNTNL